MVQIEDKIISLDVFDKHFVCDLSACKGACCVEGDSGAPLTEQELTILPDIYEKVKPYMQHKGIQAVEDQGFFVVDPDGDNTTPLVNNNECAFVSFGVVVNRLIKSRTDSFSLFPKPRRQVPRDKPPEFYYFLLVSDARGTIEF